MNELLPISSATVPALVAAAGERAGMRFLEFFAANIRNPHTRRAYARAADEFLAWCAAAGVPSIGTVQPAHCPGLKRRTSKAHPAVPGRSICSMGVPCAGDQRRAGGDIGWLGRDR